MRKNRVGKKMTGPYGARMTPFERIADTLTDLASRPPVLNQLASQAGMSPFHYQRTFPNHLACLIPCHRVIQSSGALGGYRWGTERKAALLGRELEAICPAE